MGARLLDLDALRRPSIIVKLMGKRYTLVANSLDNFASAGELQKAVKDATEKGEPKAVRDAMSAFLGFLAPTIPADIIGALEDRQMTALIEAWSAQTSEYAKSDDAEAKAVMEDPTSPG